MVVGLLKKKFEMAPKRDYVYYLAVAYARIKVSNSMKMVSTSINVFQEYDRALGYVDILLQSEEDNRQAAALKELINERMKKGFFFRYLKRIVCYFFICHYIEIKALFFS